MVTRRAALFVDVVNQYFAASKHFGGRRIDYARYLARAGEGYELTRALAYGVQMQNEAAPFLAVLRDLGYEPRYRQAVTLGDRPDIRRTDRNMTLAMDVWRIIDRVDVVILGSNDPDLVPLIARVKELGVQVVVYACGTGREIRDLADRLVEVGGDVLKEASNAPHL